MPRGIYTRKAVDLVERYWKYAIVVKDGCWRWGGYKVPDGYGYLSVNRRLEGLKFNVYAHRISWEIHRGPILNGLFVLHKCDNPECTNPEHLFLGTNTDNMRDCVRKGRDNKKAKSHLGEKNGFAKLTREAVLEIRASNECGPVLGEKFGVTRSCISSVRNNRTWREMQ